MAKKQSAGKKAMFNEAKAKAAKKQPHHTKMHTRAARSSPKAPGGAPGTSVPTIPTQMPAGPMGGGGGGLLAALSGGGGGPMPPQMPGAGKMMAPKKKTKKKTAGKSNRPRL